MRLQNTFSRGNLAAMPIVLGAALGIGATTVRSAVGDPGDPAPNTWSTWSNVAGSTITYRYKPTGYKFFDAAQMEFKGVTKIVDVTVSATYLNKDGSAHFPYDKRVRKLIPDASHMSTAEAGMPLGASPMLGLVRRRRGCPARKAV